ncbi:bifunctional adenosylcobinamide kinase/adenosylcobinamide-phosphate guanylyltransferase [Leptolyngbya sp. FACHB-671]|uniref:bifunctional adenosylcobinamide kinase/adenosylcobinamide-phosphate guanylyltransferase n=1 Tax=Leptolyngbya sp. FACHB-671 TaxID=2692812 RepID=UPI001683A22B|nr:bifunctional adenosylcobinamide kinase/adenosylcobinamide-phosphate guanylyltransferase [Leptolyngbya sp. FACHB-671]
MSSNLRQLILVTGPARSGKSEWAEHLAEKSGKSVVYVATAQELADDAEWRARIEQHQQRRPAYWQTRLVPIELSKAICAAAPIECLLIDSLGTWLANLLEQDEILWEQTLKELLTSLINTTSDVILVSEETGWGVVPAYPIGRTFRDRLGKLTREIGAIATSTYLVTAGHVLNLSQLGSPLPRFHPVGDEIDSAKP